MLGDTDASVGMSLVPCLKKNKAGNVRSAKHLWRVHYKRKINPFLLYNYLRRCQQYKILRVMVSLFCIVVEPHMSL